MQYFNLVLRRIVEKSVRVQSEGKPSVEVVVIYPTDSTTGFTAVRGKSIRSAKQTARNHNLY